MRILAWIMRLLCISHRTIDRLSKFCGLSNIELRITTALADQGSNLAGDQHTKEGARSRIHSHLAVEAIMEFVLETDVCEDTGSSALWTDSGFHRCLHLSNIVSAKGNRAGDYSIPCAASHRSASKAAMQPVPAAVIAWRK